MGRRRPYEFRPLIESVRARVGDEPVWMLSALKEFLEYNDWDDIDEPGCGSLAGAIRRTQTPSSQRFNCGARFAESP
jgi:hypothetical protein